VPADQPPWRRVFDGVERIVGEPLEELVASRRFIDVALFKRQAERAARGAVDGAAGTFLHFLNVPARTDVRQLSRQVAALGADVRSLSAEVGRLAPDVGDRKVLEPGDDEVGDRRVLPSGDDESDRA